MHGDMGMQGESQRHLVTSTFVNFFILLHSQSLSPHYHSFVTISLIVIVT